MLRARSLNVLAIGETTAKLLGEDTKKLVWLVYLMASLLTAAAVAIAGSVGFIGLIVPHAVRMLTGPDHRILIPAACLLGGAFLVLADTAARSILAPQQLPVGVITALIGVPLFLLLLHRAKVVR
jgi:iron complex transport system permease protein